MDFSYRFSNDHLYYMKEQVFEAREDLTVYSRLSRYEHEQIKSFLPARPRNVMDLGCGLGRAGIYLNATLKEPAHFIMADTTGDTPNEGIWDAKEHVVYNNLSLTQSFCKMNGMEDFEIFDMFEDDWVTLPKVDLIMSHCAVGVHFPIEGIMNKLLSISTQDVTMIFGLRTHKLYDGNSFSDFFEKVTFIETPMPEGDATGFPWQDWLVLQKRG